MFLIHWQKSNSFVKQFTEIKIEKSLCTAAMGVTLDGVCNYYVAYYIIG